MTVEFSRQLMENGVVDLLMQSLDESEVGADLVSKSLEVLAILSYHPVVRKRSIALATCYYNIYIETYSVLCLDTLTYIDNVQGTYDNDRSGYFRKIVQEIRGCSGWNQSRFIIGNIFISCKTGKRAIFMTSDLFQSRSVNEINFIEKIKIFIKGRRSSSQAYSVWFVRFY